MVDLIVDGNSLFARSWYAVARDSTDPQDCIRAALVTLLGLLNVNADKLGEHVDRMLFAWDGANKRDKGREEKPSMYHETREMFIDTLTLLFSTAHACSDTHEADDVVATAAYHSPADSVYVVSGDKDLQQLQGGNVQYYCLNHKGTMSSRAIADKWGVKKPAQVAIALAIIGDKVDGIKGIKGWGPKKVKTLFENVNEKMNFAEALDAITRQIPEKLVSDFYGDLELTLLDSLLPGIPKPAPIQLADLDVAQELKLPGLMDYYRPVYGHYRQRGKIVDSLGDEEDVPEH